MRYFVIEMINIFRILSIVLFLFPVFTIAQYETIPKDNHREIFTAVESGIDDGIVEKFSGYFGKQVYVSITGEESGYYSTNQAYYILKNFMNARKPLGFTFTTYGMTDKIPFATGRAAFRYKGNREYIQVYVSLCQVENHWVIDKVNFY
jgi:hypothetical protein